ncbi:anhydro-N-acetylmuramic acid kinase [Pelagovum pacificum]|uniref:Anhydro-N-acetylmuramic acid kinase n=1 Tax=Pelagovum pacificum TaxID=2588711 RepID=A0A5C5GC52_9RHOB|nr:anhydro-N-acetylmuramic acid kinase [Pelagovum pacificum]QQA44804.1 anhydro-N-acetylmuramic acid kinase [Pelagovum pacificum]TNY32090.1 anhydro-N-acetylmuramic acid kinase [Pelagovum pacificum]
MLKTGPVRALGAMSGTSLDGVDAAVLVTDGHEIFEFGETAYRPYSPTDRMILRGALGRWPGDPGVAAAAEIVEEAHMACLEGIEAELIGFHGQTLAHDPAGRGTHQAGDGQVLADYLGLPVVWDFRSADVRLGGQGAPLAPFYHFALARHIGATEPVAFLNLGGVGNLTWIDPTKPKPDADGALLAFDTGPANAPMDDFCAARLGRDRDEGGALARRGTVDEAVLDRFTSQAFFYRMPPKSLDRNDFDWLTEAVADLSDADALATLAGCAAAGVVTGLDHCPSPPERLLVTGGGRHNATLMRMIAAGADCPVEPVEAVGLDGDMMEAQAFAFLAVRVARGLPTSAPGTTGVAAAVGGGSMGRPATASRASTAG